MSHNFANKVCIYCQKKRSTGQGDHVFARSFFAVTHRANLPKAPACKDCGDKKAKLEHYLSTLLLFGGRHSDAHKNLMADAPRRLERNKRLHRELADGLQMLPDGRLVLPFDVERLHAWAALVCQGLLWHHAGSYLPETYSSEAITPPKHVLATMRPLVDQQQGTKHHHDLGDGTFVYAGTVSEGDRCISTWWIDIMSGLTTTGDREQPELEASTVLVVTAPQKITDKISEL